MNFNDYDERMKLYEAALKHIAELTTPPNHNLGCLDYLHEIARIALRDNGVSGDKRVAAICVDIANAYARDCGCAADIAAHIRQEFYLYD